MTLLLGLVLLLVLSIACNVPLYLIVRADRDPAEYRPIPVAGVAYDVPIITSTDWEGLVL